MDLSRDAQENTRIWEAANPIHKLGAFNYDQADYQLTPELINADFTAYIEFMKTGFPDSH